MGMMETQQLVESRRGDPGGMGGAGAPGLGLVSFAGVMLMLVGFFNIIDGVAALGNSDYLVNRLLFANMNAWGWFFLVFGVVQICAGVAILRGALWARIVGIATAGVNAIAQLSWAHTNTVWAVSAIAIDVIVIYALVAHGGRAAES